MKETDEQLAKLIEKGLETANKTGEFIIEQAPELIQQLILYKTIEKSVLIIIFSIILYYCIKYSKIEIKKEYDWNEFIIVPCSVVAIFCGIGLLFLIPDLIQLIFAPKIYLIEYISHLIK